MTSLTIAEIMILSPKTTLKAVRLWWMRRAERHYNMCADVELQRAREAQLNHAYYQKRAALARSAQSDL